MGLPVLVPHVVQRAKSHSFSFVFCFRWGWEGSCSKSSCSKVLVLRAVFFFFLKKLLLEEVLQEVYLATRVRSLGKTCQSSSTGKATGLLIDETSS